MSFEPYSQSESITYDDQLGGYRFQHDRTNDVPLSTAIVRAIANVSNTPAEDLDPLYDVVDPDALNGIFAPHADGRERVAGGLWFYYSGYRVIVYPDGEIKMEPLDEATDSSRRAESVE